ncbi:FAD dependent oxidoreductase family protein, partial [Vibrio parahaemolyticus VP2007-007]
LLVKMWFGLTVVYVLCVMMSLTHRKRSHETTR